MKKKKKESVTAVVSVLLAAALIFTLFARATDRVPLETGKVDPAFSDTEGTIYSSDGEILCQYTEDSPSKYGYRGTLTYPELYSPVIGYNTYSYGRSGIRRIYKDDLYSGKNLTLTINHRLQQQAYSLVSEFGKDASCVVIENKTGAIRALVSYKQPITVKDESGKKRTLYYTDKNGIEKEVPFFDANNTNTFYRAVSQNGGDSILPDAYYYPEYSIPTTPGSVFKVLTSIPIIEKGVENKRLSDYNGTISSNLVINNYNNGKYGYGALREALIHSNNIWFSKIYDQYMLRGNLRDLMDRCRIGETIDLDFGSVKSAADLSSESNFIMTSFGQITSLSPVHLCSLLTSVANSGKVMKPYLIQSKSNAKNGEIDSITAETVLTETTDSKTAGKLKSYLIDVGGNYGFSDVCMKTGTAETSYGRQCWCYAGNNTYTVLVSVKNIETGGQLKNASYNILSASNKMQSNNPGSSGSDSVSDEVHETGFFAKIKNLIKG